MQYLFSIAIAVAFLFSTGCAPETAAPLPSTVYYFPSRSYSPSESRPAPSIADPEQALKSLIQSYEAGNYEESLLIARALDRQHPGTVWQRRSLFVTEQVLIGLDRPDEAKTAMLRIKKEYSEMSDYAVLALADYHFSGGRFREAAALYRDIAVQYPESSLAVRACYRQGLALHKAGLHAEATGILEAFLRHNPRSELAGEAQVTIAQAFVADARMDQAVRSYREVWSKYPGTAAELNAVNALSEIAALGIPVSPWTADEWYERGRNLYRTSRYAKAADAFGKMLETAPHSPKRPEALLRIGISGFYSGKRREAAASLEKLVNEYPESYRAAEALYWAGKCYSRLGEREKAVGILQRIVDRHPRSKWADDALFLIGNIYRDANDTRNSLAYYMRLAGDYPGSRFADSALWWNAWTWYSAGEYGKTERALQELIDRYPRSFLVHQARYWQGRAAEKQGDSAKAAAYFRKVLKGGRYTYYGYRAEERISSTPEQHAAAPDPDGVAEVIKAASEEVTEAASEEEDCVEDSCDSRPDKLQPDWTDENRRLLAAESSFRKIRELMQLDMRKEAASELWRLREELPRKPGTLIGLSKAFFELGDYYRSLLLVLRNYERHLDTDVTEIPSDIWLLAYPQGYWDTIMSYSRKYRQDPYFIAAIIRQESRFHAEALSPAGARGVMQVMPATGEWIAQSIKLPDFDRAKLFESDTAINLGTWYINFLMRRFNGDPLLVAAAYNAGPEAVASWLSRNGGLADRDEFVESIPYTETRGYVKKVLRNYFEYKRIYGKAGRSAPPVQEAARAGEAATD